MTAPRRIVLETSDRTSDWSIVAACIDSALYVGRCDFSDSAETTGGFDIEPIQDFLTWMIRDRFGSDADSLIEYIERNGLTVTSWLGLDKTENLADGLSIAEFGPKNAAQLSQVGWRSPRTCTIIEGDVLALLLLADRCQGASAWIRVEELLARAGMEGIPRDRGYV